jgi:hypothetical protein
MSELPTMIIGLAVAMGLMIAGAVVARAHDLRDVATPLAKIAAVVSITVVAVSFGLPPLLAWVDRTFPRADSADLVVLTGGLAIMSAAFATSFAVDVLRQRRWPKTRGEVISAVVEHSKVLQPGRAPSGATMTLYHPAVVYRYAVAGRAYESHCIVRGVTVGSQSPDSAERFVRRHPVGSTIELRYDPRDPAQSTLELPWLGVVLPWLLALFFAAVCVSVSGYFRRG